MEIQEQFTTKISASLGGFTAQVYSWMGLALLITTVVAFLCSQIPALRMLYTIDGLVLIAFLFQLVLVMAISFLIEKMNPFVAIALFLFYSATMGFTLTGIFLVYTASSIFMVFGATAAIFIIMSVIGYVTKADLTSWGMLAWMGLFGIIIGTLINLFLRSTGVSLFLTYAGILVFLVLIAYDTQKIKSYGVIGEQTGKTFQYSILAALTLYLDFINLLIRLLSILGRKK